jgi:hypothetical protein
LICSHAGVITDDPMVVIHRRIRFWEELARDAQDLADQGVSNTGISRRLLGSEGWMTRLSGGDFSKANLIRGLLRSDKRHDALV